MTDADILNMTADAYTGKRVAFIGDLDEVSTTFSLIVVPMGEIAHAVFNAMGGGHIAFASGGRIDFLVDTLGVLMGRKFDAVYGRYAGSYLTS